LYKSLLQADVFLFANFDRLQHSACTAAAAAALMATIADAFKNGVKT
jgi:hypothetical protein